MNGWYILTMKIENYSITFLMKFQNLNFGSVTDVQINGLCINIKGKKCI